jgi:hypothetical protein
MRPKPRIKDFYPLIGRIRIQNLVCQLKNKVRLQLGKPQLSNAEFAEYLNSAIQRQSAYQEQLNNLNGKPFCASSIYRLLQLGDDTIGGGEVGLLQFLAIFTDYTFGEMMMILANQGKFKMSQISSLIYICIQEYSLSDPIIAQRLQALGSFGFSFQLFKEFEQGKLCPSDDQLRVIKEVLDPNERIVSEAQWIRAAQSDRAGNCCSSISRTT